MGKVLQPSDPVELGAEYKDVVSGHRGIATSETRFLNGCRQVALVPKVDNAKGKEDNTWYFDVEQLERVGDGVLKKLGRVATKAAPKREPKGGAPTRYSASRGRR